MNIKDAILLCFLISATTIVNASTLSFDRGSTTAQITSNQFLTDNRSSHDFKFEIDRDLAQGDIIELHFLAKGLTLDSEPYFYDLPVEVLEPLVNSDFLTVRGLVKEPIYRDTTITFSCCNFKGESPTPHDLYVVASVIVDGLEGPIRLEESNELKIVEVIEHSDSKISSTIKNPFNVLISHEAHSTTNRNFLASIAFYHTNTNRKVLFNRAEGLKKYTFEYSLTGDFSFLADTENSSAVASHSSVNLYVNNQEVDDINVILSENGAQISVEAEHIFNRDVRLEINSSSEEIIPQEVLATVKVENSYQGSNATLTLLENVHAGNWHYNGEVFAISSMPFSNEYAQLISLRNRTSRKLDLDIILYSEQEEKIYLKNAVQIAGQKVTNISQDIKNLITEHGLKGNIAIDIIADTSRDNVSLTALYYNKADGDRAVIATGN